LKHRDKFTFTFRNILVRNGEQGRSSKKCVVILKEVDGKSKTEENCSTVIYKVWDASLPQGRGDFL